MASAFSLLSEDHFMCSICMDVFTDPISTPCGHNYCKACITNYWDTKEVCKCPLCNRTCFKNQEFFVNKVFSEMADRFRAHKLKEEYKAKSEAEVGPMIQERLLKIQEVKRSVELSRKDADTVIADCIQHVFTALISCIERSQAELISVIEEKQKTTEKLAEGFIKVLQQEVTQLENRSSELKQDKLLQNFKSNNSPPLTKSWTKRNVSQSQSLHVGTVRTAMSQLEKTLGQAMKKMCNVELMMVREYGVDVVLDPRTANCELILSEDGKQVAHGSDVNNLFGYNDRFNHYNTERSTSYANVLGNQSFSGSFYYEVRVTGKPQWKLGVVRESINRRVLIELSPNNGCWTISLCNGNDYVAAAADRDVYLPVKEKVQRVGVFVDYEEGTVSFYGVETGVHLYSFTGCTFTEKLLPFFDPGRARRNHAPLVICPMPPIYHG